MQEIPQPKFTLSAIEDTLLTRDYLSVKKRTGSIEEKARFEAKKIINTAWDESDAIKKHAYQEGLVNGLLYTVKLIMEYFSSVEELHTSLQRSLHKKIETVLTEFFDNDILLKFTHNWYKNIDKSTHHEVIVTLPEKEKKLANVLCENIRETLSLNIRVKYKNSDYLQLKYGDQLLEINLCEFQSELVNRFVYNNDDIFKKVRALNNIYLKKLSELFQ